MKVPMTDRNVKILRNIEQILRLDLRHTCALEAVSNDIEAAVRKLEGHWPNDFAGILIREAAKGDQRTLERLLYPDI